MSDSIMEASSKVGGNLNLNFIWLHFRTFDLLFLPDRVRSPSLSYIFIGRVNGEFKREEGSEREERNGKPRCGMKTKH